MVLNLVMARYRVGVGKGGEGGQRYLTQRSKMVNGNYIQHKPTKAYPMLKVCFSSLKHGVVDNR